MSNLVFLKDYLDFLNHRAEVHQKIIQGFKDVMKKNQDEYETTFLYKILFKKFGWKSFAKFQYQMFDQIFYSLDNSESYLEKYQNEIEKITYQRKSMEVLIYADIDNQLVECIFPKFYNWAKTNERPYETTITA
jgi:hypothetical protein